MGEVIKIGTDAQKLADASIDFIKAIVDGTDPADAKAKLGALGSSVTEPTEIPVLAEPQT